MPIESSVIVSWTKLPTINLFVNMPIIPIWGAIDSVGIFEKPFARDANIIKTPANTEKILYKS